MHRCSLQGGMYKWISEYLRSKGSDLFAKTATFVNVQVYVCVFERERERV